MKKNENETLLGEGSFSKCFMKTEGEANVVKKIAKFSKDNRMIETESEILMQISHVNIIKLISSTLSNEQALHITLEFASFGNLQVQILYRQEQKMKFKEDIVLRMMCQLLSALQYLDENQILHRDIKPSNILIAVDRSEQFSVLKLADFGLALDLKVQSSVKVEDEMIGSPAYFAPEVILGKPHSHKSDIWALGCVFYSMLTLARAYSGDEISAIFFNILANRRDEKIPASYNQNLHQITETMLSPDPEQRPSSSTFNDFIAEARCEDHSIPINTFTNPDELLPQDFNFKAKGCNGNAEMPCIDFVFKILRHNLNDSVQLVECLSGIRVEDIAGEKINGSFEGQPSTSKTLVLSSDGSLAEMNSTNHEQVRYIEGVKQIALAESFAVALCDKRSLFIWGEIEQISCDLLVDDPKSKLYLKENYNTEEWPDWAKTALSKVQEEAGEDNEIMKSTLELKKPVELNLNGFLDENIVLSEVSCGIDFVMLLAANGEVFAFGENTVGQLGIGDVEDRSSPTKVFLNDPIERLEVGNEFCLALSCKKHVFSWGSNLKCELGREIDLNYCCTPSNIPGFSNEEEIAKSIACGSNHSFITTENNSIWSWGLNDSLQTGHQNDHQSECSEEEEFSTNLQVIYPPSMLDLSINPELNRCGNDYSMILGETTDSSNSVFVCLGLNRAPRIINYFTDVSIRNIYCTPFVAYVSVNRGNPQDI